LSELLGAAARAWLQVELPAVSLLFELLGFLLSGFTIAIFLLVHAPGEARLG
jgi:hypothetical protein